MLNQFDKDDYCILNDVEPNNPEVNSNNIEVNLNNPEVSLNNTKVSSNNPEVDEFTIYGSGVEFKMISNKEYLNHHNEIPRDKRDDTLNELIPETVNKCSLIAKIDNDVDDVCISSNVIEDISQKVGIEKDIPIGEKISKIYEKTSCDDDMCVLKKSGLPSNVIKKEIETRFKIKGPTDTSLLSNFDIDDTLHQWSLYFKNFYAYNFNMSGFQHQSLENNRVVDKPDTLETINYSNLYSLPNKYRCAGCVINTDNYNGQGKHWMALFVDTRYDDCWTIEFFNSSGNHPTDEWTYWLLKTKTELEELRSQLSKQTQRSRKNQQLKIKIINVCDIQQQQSLTECGVYSLFYIWARLNNVSASYFNENIVPDQLIYEFRFQLFDGGKNINEFKFKEFGGLLKWEK